MPLSELTAQSRQADQSVVPACFQNIQNKLKTDRPIDMTWYRCFLLKHSIINRLTHLYHFQMKTWPGGLLICLLGGLPARLSSANGRYRSLLGNILPKVAYFRGEGGSPNISLGKILFVYLIRSSGKILKPHYNPCQEFQLFWKNFWRPTDRIPRFRCF